jgi:hypothetical protein
MIYGGNVRLKLYEAPYTVTARLQALGVGIDVRSPAPIIQSLYDKPSDSYAAMTLEPFDYGSVDNGGTLYNTGPHDIIYWDGTAAQMVGDGNTSYQNFDEVVMPRAGGYTLGQVYVSYRNQRFQVQRGGAFVPVTVQCGFLTAPGGYQIYSRGGYYVGFTSYVYVCGVGASPAPSSGYQGSLTAGIQGSGLSFLWQANYFNFFTANMIGNRKGILFPAGGLIGKVGYLPYSQFDPELFGGNHWDFTQQIDDNPALDAEFQAVSAFTNNGQTFGWLSSVLAAGDPTRKYVPVIFDPLAQKYWTIQLEPQTPNGAAAINSLNGSFKIDQNGTLFYYVNGSAYVFHTFSLSLDFNPIVIDSPPPLSYPCFNPCNPHLIGS